MPAAVITACASVTVAVLAFLLNQRAQLRQERRQARLTRINSQLRELYGPLNALVDVNERIWHAMRSTTLPRQPDRHPGSGSEEWRRWRDQALMPANRQMRDLIVDHADLLIEQYVPEALRDFCAHVASLEVVLAGQARGLYESALLRHPGARYVEYVRESFAHLKCEQRELLDTTIRTPASSGATARSLDPSASLIP